MYLVSTDSTGSFYSKLVILPQLLRRQEAVRQLLCEQLKEALEDRKELMKEKLEDRKKAKRTESENTGSCKLAVQHSYTDRSETVSC